MTGPSAGDADRLAAFLNRYHLGGEALSAAELRAAAARISAQAPRTTDELIVQGHVGLTVVHGDVETEQDAAALRELRRWVDRHPGAVARTDATNDTTSWWCTPPDADAHAAALQALAQEHNPGWWQIRRSPAGGPT